MTNYQEIFPHSPLSEVVFEARFPILFGIPQKVSDFQLSVIDEFEKAEERRVQDISIGRDEKPELRASEVIWQFSHKEGDPTIRLFRNKITVFSKVYECYDSENRKSFRPNIRYAVEKFLDLFQIREFSRIGLRYINKCKVEELSNDWFRRFFKPVVDIDKYPLENILEKLVIIRFKKGNQKVLLQNALVEEKGIKKYVLDFDAYEESCATESYLQITDRLHEIILREFHSLITDDYRNKLRGE